MWLTKYFDIDALAYGVLIGGVLQFLVVFFPFLKLLKTYSLKIDFKDIYLKLLGIKLIPMLIGVFARQINTIVDQFFASFLTAGSITALENASRVYLLPVGVFGVTISNVLFPSISRAAANNDKEETNRRLVSALNFLNFLTIPSLFVLTFFSKELEQFVRWHNELEINAEGIEALHHLLHRVKKMQLEIDSLTHELKFYRSL